jgi:hypothetical protein
VSIQDAVEFLQQLEAIDHNYSWDQQLVNPGAPAFQDQVALKARPDHNNGGDSDRNIVTVKQTLGKLDSCFLPMYINRKPQKHEAK